MLRMILVFILTTSFTFLPQSPTAFAVPIGPGQSFPMPPAEGEVDWVTEAEALEQLKALATEDLSQISQDVVVAIHRQITESMTQTFMNEFPALLVISVGVVSTWYGIRLGKNIWPSRWAPVIIGVVLMAGGLALVLENPLQPSQVTYRPLRDVVSEEVAQQLEALGQWMTQVSQAIDQKEFIEIEVTKVVTKGRFETDSPTWNLVQLRFFNDFDFTTGAPMHLATTLEFTSNQLYSDSVGRWFLRMSAWETSVAAFQKVKNYVKSKIFSRVAQTHLALFSAFHQVAPSQIPDMVNSVRLERTILGPIGGRAFRVGSVDQPAPEESFATHYEIDMGGLLNPDVSSLTLEQ